MTTIYLDEQMKSHWKDLCEAVSVGQVIMESKKTGEELIAQDT